MICVYPADCTDFSTNGNGIPGSAVGGGDTFDEANAETKQHDHCPAGGADRDQPRLRGRDQVPHQC